MNKKFKMLAVSAAMLVAGFSITSCGGTSDKEIAESAIKRLPNISNQIKETQIQLYSEMTVSVNNVAKKVNITYTATPAENFDFGEAKDGKYFVKVNLPTETIDYTITATATFNKAMVTREFSGKLLPNTDKPSNTSTVAEALAATDGTIVTIKGVTANARSGKGFFVVDSTGAIYVFDNGGKTNEKFQYGQTVTVTATRGKKDRQNDYSSAQLVYGSDSSIVVNDSGEAFPKAGATETTVEAIRAWKGDKAEDHSGQFVKVRATLKREEKTGNNGPYITWKASSGSTSITLYASNGTLYDEQFNSFVGKEADLYLAVFDLKIGSYWRTSLLFADNAA